MGFMPSVPCDYSTRYSFLRMMGRHRNLVSKLALAEVRENGNIEWIDSPFTNLRGDGDTPLFGLHFLKQINISSETYNNIQTEYDAVFENCHTKVAWDAIGKTSSGTILLLKAIACSEELYSLKSDLSNMTSYSKNAFEEFQVAMNCTANASWQDYYSLYVQELLIVWMFKKHGIRAKHITLCIIPEMSAYQESVLNLRSAISKRNSDLAITKSALIRNDSCVCYLGVSGDMVYDITSEEEVIYREWFREKAVILVGGLGATIFEYLHGKHKARYVLFDNQSRLSEKIAEKPEVFSDKYLTMISSESLIKDQDAFLCNLDENTTCKPIYIVGGANGKTTRNIIRAIFGIQSFPMDKVLLILVEPFAFEKSGKDYEDFSKEIQELCKCKSINVQSISDAMDKNQKMGEFQHHLVSEIAQIIF